MRMVSDRRPFYVAAAFNGPLPHPARETPMLLLIALPSAVVMWAIGLTLVRWRLVSTWLFDTYRPELHYMRGPGPKWREKHG